MHRAVLFRSFGGFSRQGITADMLAGLTLAAIAIPEQMATARLGDFPPETGFIAFIAAAIAFAAFGASRTISVGADSTITPIFAASIAAMAGPGLPAYPLLACTLALLVGIFLVLAGLFRLGWIANLLSEPVTTGFLAGIAIHIAVSQLPNALGLQLHAGELPGQIASLVENLGHANPWPLAVALGVLAVTLLVEHLNPKIPGALLGMIGAAALVAIFGLSAHGVTMLAVPSSSSLIARPFVPAAHVVIRLLPLAFIIALVVMVQSAATARSFPTPGDTDAFNRDLVGVGAANVFAFFAGTFAVNASPPRTAIAAESGARSQLCGLVAAAILGCLILFGGGLLRFIPGATLAGILFFVCYRITRVQMLRTLFRQSKAEFALVIATILAIVVLPIEVGVAIGIILSLLQGTWSATRTQLIELQHIPHTTIWWPQTPDNPTERIAGIRVVAFQAPLFFLNAARFRADFTRLLGEGGASLIVLEAGSIVEIDFTAAQILSEAIAKCRDAGVTMAIARLESLRAVEALRRFGVLDLLGPDRLFRSVDDAVKALGPHGSH